jgi:ATP-dependent RNA helicase RhlE
VLVATPGRLLDLMNTRAVDIGATEVFVLDEADQMLDLGFIVPIRRVVKALPNKRQTLFFSATMPGDIAKLADTILRDPEQVSVAPVATTAERVDQRVILVETARKRALLVDLLGDAALSRVLVFTRTKHGADKVGQALAAAGLVSSVIHGNKSQGQRLRALEAFKSGEVRILVATDIAARGIDIDAVSHVVNFDLPDVPEAYVHRIGRTARAGARGDAIAFCDESERHLLRAIEKLTRQSIPCTDRRGAHAPDRGGERGNEPRPQREGHGHARDADHRRADHRGAKRPPHKGGPARQNSNRDGAGKGHGAKHHGGAPAKAKAFPKARGSRSDRQR